MGGVRGPWLKEVINEHGRLANGFGNWVRATKTIEFIIKGELPKGRTFTNEILCDYCPLKSEQFRFRLTVSGDILLYLEYASSPAASLLESKLLFNSILSY